MKAARRLTSLLVAAAAATLAPTIGPVTPAHAAAPNLSPPAGEAALTWTPAYMSQTTTFSSDQARLMAQRFDLVAATAHSLSAQSSMMRQVNPRLSLLAYSSGTTLESGRTGSLSESAFAHSASGSRIWVPEWHAYLMRASSSEWQARSRDLCRQRVSRMGANGCLVDVMGLGVYSQGTLSAPPADPTTHQPLTQSQYRSQLVSLASYLDDNDSSLAMIHNAVSNSWRYWRDATPSRPLVSGMRGAQMEDFLRGARDGSLDFPLEEKWQRNVDVVSDLESRGETGLFSTKVWSDASAAVMARWQRYSMASFLMAANGHSYLAFMPSRTTAAAIGSASPYQMPSMGAATTAMTTQADGARIRRFEKGVAIVNPTSHVVHVSLDRPMKTLGGVWVDHVDLASADAQVLTRS